MCLGFNVPQFTGNSRRCTSLCELIVDLGEQLFLKYVSPVNKCINTAFIVYTTQEYSTYNILII